MVQCEMCGAETPSPKTVKIEGAELSVCADCADFGTEVSTGTESSTSTKYSTSSESGQSGAAESSATSGSGGGSSSRRRDMFDEMEEVVTDYDERIRTAREAAELSQAELADQLNEKASQIRKLERGETLPSDRMRRKLERALDIDLIEGSPGEEDEADWSGGGGSGGITLGDVVERKE